MMCVMNVTKNGGREAAEMRERGEDLKVLGNGDKEMRYWVRWCRCMYIPLREMTERDAYG